MEFAVGDLTDKCKIARRINGSNVTAVVTCHSTRWSTKFNPHGKRPDFRVERWMPFDGDRQLTKPVEPSKLIASPAPESCDSCGGSLSADYPRAGDGPGRNAFDHGPVGAVAQDGAGANPGAGVRRRNPF